MVKFARINGGSHLLPVANDYSIRDQAGATSVSQVTLRLEGQPIPEPLDEIELLDDGLTVQFCGICGIPETVTFSTGYEPDDVTLQVQSLNSVLRRRTVNEAWQDATVTEIVQDIFDSYISQEWFTLGTISTIAMTFKVYTAARIYIGDVLDELASKAGATWTVDSRTREFSFSTRESLRVVPAKTKVTMVKRSESARDLRSRQIITGAKGKTSVQVASLSWAANQASFSVSYPLDHAVSATVAGSPVGVGVSGFDDADVSKTFLWSYASNSVRLNPAATTKPTTGSAVTFSFVGQYSIEVQAENAALITEIGTKTSTSGIIENIQSDTSIVDAEDADQSAQALLSKFGESNVSISLTVDDPADTEPLTVWDFSLPAIRIVGQFVITQRTRQRLTVDKERVSLVLADRDWYMKYGDVFGKIDRSLTAMSVRADAVVIHSRSAIDVASASEEWTVGVGDVICFPGMEPGPLFDGFFPTPALGPFYPDTAQFPGSEPGPTIDQFYPVGA